MKTRLAALATLLAGCATGSGAVYPPRPPSTPGAPIAEPSPSRVVVHATVTAAALKGLLEAALPPTGEGTFPLLGGDRHYAWRREALALSFQQGLIGVRARITGSLDVLGGRIEMPIELQIFAEPVVTSDYQARLQSLQVRVSSQDSRLKLAQSAGGALDKIREQIEALLTSFSYDLRPMVAEAHARMSKPLDLPLGDAHGCALLRVAGIEAGPTVLASGVEKDLAVVVAPSVTLPCTAPATPPALPPLANVSSLPSGPFTVVVPVAARYDELARAMVLAFTDGKLYFSPEFKNLYMEKPEVYASRDQLVLKLHINGRIQKYGIDMDLDGDLFMSGHPQVIDNELRVPDLEPTIETRSFLLRLKAALDGDSIRDQARAALRLDIGERLQAARAKLSTDLSFTMAQGCLRSEVTKIEVTGVHPHPSYLRVYVAASGQAAVYLPCPAAP